MQIHLKQTIHVGPFTVAPGLYDVTFGPGVIILTSGDFSVTMPNTPANRLLLGLVLDEAPPLNEKLGEKIKQIREKSKDEPVEPDTPKP